MNIKPVLACLVLLLASGCGRAPPEAADPEQARQALVTALDAWKRGEKPADLQGGNPAVHVADVDWREGCKLQSYTILPNQEKRGGSLRVQASLSLRDPKGKAAEKRVAYLIGTRPVITIVREFQ